jgi:hypothetical protein
VRRGIDFSWRYEFGAWICGRLLSWNCYRRCSRYGVSGGFGKEIPVFRDDTEDIVLSEARWVDYDVMIEETGEVSCTVK